MHFPIDYVSTIIGVMIIILAEVLKEATQLKEDTELTI
ncbi:DUF2975 domain-containing protein [Clostridium akagii]